MQASIGLQRVHGYTRLLRATMALAHSSALAPVGGGGGGGAVAAALLAPGLFFYHHIAKTAGTSWSVDIARLGGLSHCNTSHLVGPHSLEQLTDSVTSTVLGDRRQVRF